MSAGLGPTSEGAGGLAPRSRRDRVIAVLEHAGCSPRMGDVLKWVSEQDMPTELSAGEVDPLLNELLDDDDPDVALQAEYASKALYSTWTQDSKIVSSVYTTAGRLIAGWGSPAVAEATEGTSISLEWLIGGNNSLYVVAPPQDAKRLAPLFGGVINDLLGQCFEHVARTGKPIAPPLLVVVDEAGQIPMANLPEFASTVASLGVQLVTVWQTIAQIKDHHGDNYETVLTNHITKLVYPGLSDKISLEYLAVMQGEEEAQTAVRSLDRRRWGHGSNQTQGTRLNVTPLNVIRTMRTGHSMLVHGQLPVAELKSVPWYQRKDVDTSWDRADTDLGLPSINRSAGLSSAGDSWARALAELDREQKHKAAVTDHDGRYSMVADMQATHQ